MENITVFDRENITIRTLIEYCASILMINCTGIGNSTDRDLCESGIANCTDFDPINIQATRTSKTGINTVLMIIGALTILLGVIGNGVTIVIVRLRNEFHTATYTTIALLAFVDLVATCLRGLNVVNILHYLQWFYSILSMKFIRGLSIVTFVTYVCSCVHVVILARLRYKLLAYPIQGMTISARNIVYQSLSAWGVSCMLGVLYGFSVFYMDSYQLGIVEIIIGIAVLLCTVVPIIVFHVLKIRKLRGGISPMSKTINSMNKMVLAICVAQIVTTMCVTIYVVLPFLTAIARLYRVYYAITSQLLLLLIHTMNPLFFFYFTSCRRMLRANRNNNDQRNRRMETPV